MKLENILEAAKSWNPVKILTEPDEEYVTLKEGEVVVDFNDELMMSYSNGLWQISYGDWIGDYENPMPVIDMILSGYMKTKYDENHYAQLILVDDNDKIEDLNEDILEAAEQERLARVQEDLLNRCQA